MVTSFVKASRSLVLCGATLAFLFACGEEEKKKPAASCESSQATVATASYTELWNVVFSKQCVGCHNPETNTKMEGGPDILTQDAFYANLVGKTRVSKPDWQGIASRACEDTYFVKADDAKNSLLAAIFDQSDTAIAESCNVSVHGGPPNSMCITKPNIIKLKEWINAGASK